jgi:hypothetical protein
MYVKWVIRRHKNEELANITFFDAYLVQSYKNALGEPRQRTIAYLGNLRQINNVFPVIERALFYVRMEESLKQELSPDIFTEEERAKLYAGLSEVAPVPTEDEISQGAEIQELWYSNYWHARATNPKDVSAGFARIEFEEDENAEVMLEYHLGQITVLGTIKEVNANLDATSEEDSEDKAV